MGKSRPHGRARASVVAASVLALIVLALSAGAAYAAAEAFLTAPTDLTATSVDLHGIVTTSQNGTSWFFEYGKTTGYGQVTPTDQVSAGSTPVSAPVGGLDPATTYHYRLVVNEGKYSADQFSADGTFTTPAAPGTIATTGQAFAITPTSAQLNGVANPSMPGSKWLFEYGTTTAYGHTTPATTIGRGLTLVSAAATGLTANRLYHFRLVVVQPGLPTADGNDAWFTTSPFGTARLRGRHLHVHHRRVGIPLKCTGVAGATCAGTITLRARAAAKHARTVACGTARFAATAGQRPTPRMRLRRGCRTALAGARHHRLAATLRIAFTTGQRPLKRSVVLSGR